MNENVNIYFSNQLMSMDQPNVQIDIQYDVNRVFRAFSSLLGVVIDGQLLGNIFLSLYL